MAKFPPSKGVRRRRPARRSPPPPRSSALAVRRPAAAPAPRRGLELARQERRDQEALMYGGGACVIAGYLEEKGSLKSVPAAPGGGVPWTLGIGLLIAGARMRSRPLADAGRGLIAAGSLRLGQKIAKVGLKAAFAQEGAAPASVVAPEDLQLQEASAGLDESDEESM